jgi:hypothetical protein
LSPRWLLLVGCLPLAVCARDAELASGHVTFHDPQGTVAFELRATRYGYLLRPDGVRIRALTDGTLDAGTARFKDGTLEQAGRGRIVTLRSSSAIQLVTPTREPLGRLVEHDGATWVYDPGGTPLASAREERGRVLLQDRDGAARGYVTGLPARAAAALLLGGGTSQLERVLLALSLAR